MRMSEDGLEVFEVWSERGVKMVRRGGVVRKDLRELRCSVWAAAGCSFMPFSLNGGT